MSTASAALPHPPPRPSSAPLRKLSPARFPLRSPTAPPALPSFTQRTVQPPPPHRLRTPALSPSPPQKPSKPLPPPPALRKVPSPARPTLFKPKPWLQLSLHPAALTHRHNPFLFPAPQPAQKFISPRMAQRPPPASVPHNSTQLPSPSPFPKPLTPSPPPTISPTAPSPPSLTPSAPAAPAPISS